MMMLCEPSLIIMLLFIKHIKSSHSAGNILGGEWFLSFVSSLWTRSDVRKFLGSIQTGSVKLLFCKSAMDSK